MQEILLREAKDALLEISNQTKGIDALIFLGIPLEYHGKDVYKRQVLERMTEEEIDLQGSGRTDAGVHAKGQIAHFHTKAVWDAEQIKKYMNEYLPEDIAILQIEQVDGRFHSRLNAKSKTYEYQMCIRDSYHTIMPEEYENNFGLFYQQDYSGRIFPKPSVAAYANITRLLESVDNCEEISAGSDTRCV